MVGEGERYISACTSIENFAMKAPRNCILKRRRTNYSRFMMRQLVILRINDDRKNCAHSCNADPQRWLLVRLLLSRR